MPRRPVANRKGPVRRRTRTGCLTCRARKIKCDEQKPRCLNCISRGVACERNVQLKWESEFLAQGLAFGREGTWTKDGRSSSQTVTGPILQPSDKFLTTPRISAGHFVNVFSPDFEPAPAERTECLEDHPELSDGTEAVVAAFRHLPTAPLPLSISAYPTIHGFDNSLLQYYVSRLCPLTAPSACVTSPFTSLVMPLIVSGGQEYILMSVMALAARHWSLTDPKWSRTAISLKGRVLAAIRQRLESSSKPMEVFSDSQIPVAMMFLCLDEILDSCDHRWVIHLRAGQDFVRRRRRLLQPFQPLQPYAEVDPLVLFAERFFAYQDVISRTACGNAPIFGLEYWQSSDDQLDYDIWTGCSPILTAIIFRITELARAREQNDISTEDYEKDVGNLSEELRAFNPRKAFMGHDDVLRRCERLKKASVDLYFLCLLKDADPATPQVTDLVKQILQETSDLVALGCVAGLMFPLFTAAVELDPLDDEETYENLITGGFVSGRRLVLEILSAMSGVALANVHRTGAVIRKVWRMRDLHLQNDHVDGQSTWPRQRNDWSKYINPYSLNISLA